MNGAGIEMTRTVSGRLDDSAPEGGLVEFLPVDGLTLANLAPDALLASSAGTNASGATDAASFAIALSPE